MKKGFTVIELIVSFVLVSIISVILFELIFTIKELYISGDIKTTLLNRQGIMTKKIYDDLNEEDYLQEIRGCGVSCLIFKYQDEEKKLLVDVAANTLTYGNYTMKLIDGSYFDTLSFKYEEKNDTTLNISEFSLDIPIKSIFLDDDFGIHIVKNYTTGTVLINNNISINDANNAIITANGINLPLRNDESITGNPSYWAKIFHQDHIGINKTSNDAYFKDRNEFEKSNNVHKFSSLKSMEVFRIPSDIKVEFSDNDSNLQSIDLIEEAVKSKEYKNETEKERKKIIEQYQNGYFELLLEYPKISSNYNLWTQTNNFTKSEPLENAYAIDIVYQGDTCKWNGLKYLTDESATQFVNGCQGGDNFTIGTKKPNITIKGPDGDLADDKASVDLWIKADEYIKKYSLSKINLQ